MPRRVGRPRAPAGENANKDSRKSKRTPGWSHAMRPGTDVDRCWGKTFTAVTESDVWIDGAGASHIGVDECTRLGRESGFRPSSYRPRRERRGKDEIP